MVTHLVENPDYPGDQSPDKSQSKTMCLPTAGTPQKKGHATPHRTPKDKTTAHLSKQQMQS